ncbi:MAG: hypothetical protein E7532_00350 [Ruminococcaceae bacterium]|nr:hypothetical protein [Oscillospiraceae bacterium]
MTTEQTVPKRRLVFAKAFGVPGIVSAIIAMGFTVTEAIAAMTSSEVVNLFTSKWLSFSMTDFVNIPVLAFCICTLAWAMFSVIMCIMSRSLGVSNKMNQTGIVLSVVSSICSVSLAFFSVVYMIFA